MLDYYIRYYRKKASFSSFQRAVCLYKPWKTRTVTRALCRFRKLFNAFLSPFDSGCSALGVAGSQRHFLTMFQIHIFPFMVPWVLLVLAAPRIDVVCRTNRNAGALT
jgi:hypothetical protein